MVQPLSQHPLLGLEQVAQRIQLPGFAKPSRATIWKWAKYGKRVNGEIIVLKGHDALNRRIAIRQEDVEEFEKSVRAAMSRPKPSPQAIVGSTGAGINKRQHDAAMARLKRKGWA